MTRPRTTRLSAVLVAVALAVLGIRAALPSGTYFEVTKHLEILTSVFRSVHEFYVEDPEPGTLMRVAIDAMLDELDPYTIYYPESRIEDIRFMNTGEYGGIGALVQPMEGRMTIVEVYEGYPAHEAGLRPGDIVLDVDGREVEADMDTEAVSDLLQGESGSAVTVGIDRPYGGGRLEFEVKRAKVRIPAVPYSGMLDDRTGYIYLSKFTRGSAGEVRKALMALRDSAGMEQLVLDLRGNGGGLLNESVSIVNLFVPKGTEIVSTRGKTDKWNKSYTALGRPTAPDMPLVVLIDGQSASASEIVSGTLQDLDRALIIGMESFGKGLVQQTKDMAFNTRLKVTVAKYYTASGRCIQRLDYGGDRDAQGKAKAVSDSLLRTFSTRMGRPVIEGRGIQPDIEVETPFMSTLLERLLDEYALFDYATAVASRLDSAQVPDPVSYSLAEADWQGFEPHLRNKGFTYSTESMAVLDDLKEVVGIEQYDGVSSEAMASLEAALEPNLSRDLGLFEAEIRQALEEEVVLRFHLAAGMVERSLTEDPTVLRALDAFGEEMESIIGTGRVEAPESSEKR
ncbi:MAG: S41 family peptidase [Bacteroidota bacterium]|nr:S41 family peptidase [Bacteroidota bacterium]MED5334691.1 S41 family peptidase [Bacteroidota bacterium]